MKEITRRFISKTFLSQSHCSKSIFKQSFDFDTSIAKYGFWKQAQFSCLRLNETPMPFIVKGTWVDDVLTTTKKGLVMKHQAIIPKCNVDLSL